ncbi:MAG: hypothetical protein ACXVAE_00855 [Candidatus Limnocylindrales bacterium]
MSDPQGPGGPPAVLVPNLEGAVIEEILPATQRRPKRERGERPLLQIVGLRT